MRRLALMLVVLTAVAAGCGSSGESASGSPSPSTQAEASPTPASEHKKSPLEGTWRTGTVTLAEVEAMLREAGLQKWIQPFRTLPEEDPVAEENVFTLTIRAGNWDLDWEADGATPVPVDFGGHYEIEGNRVTNFHHDDSNTFRWSVDGDTLTLTWLETTFGRYRGIPEEVLQRATYQTAPFKRQS